MNRSNEDPGRILLLAIEPFLDAGCLTNALTQVVQLGTTDFTTAHDFDIRDAGRMQQEHALYANTLEHPTHGDGFVNSAVAHRDDGAFVGLDALFAAFLDHNTNSNRVPDIKDGQV
ncbi:hypothetical protein AMR42_13665 [Limnothrix sp. PR1529]|nr:hypothetical protein BCR12_12210 [Limnothrix sp. P13C2]PIB08516.1 hypothetical protein AMR42_13665 [Limnothrix sp. PR1529]